ncbi:MAG: alginate lyase family protein [Prevotellaceae bacterium]|nr:alginate lyase family protein [Prevotellaceae bacterium]
MKSLTKILLVGIVALSSTASKAQDFTQLKTAVESAETYIESINKNDYPASALAEYMDAITVAKNAIIAGTAKQTEINSLATALTTAKTKFDKTKGFVFDIADVVSGYDTERGFRHPGGLHTQADFDRVKQQLKEGNKKVTAAYNILKNAEFSQSTVVSSPVETIVRGGGTGENYINAARGATMAYQNALRWKIDGTKANADNAVKILMAWCNTTKYLGGDSNVSLGSGLYGYQFAQAAELMRDYEGWSEADFNKFKKWMLNVWYPNCINFLRGRHGTWENSSKWWQAPGHYWSNWGLCNALAVITIGVLCDDVSIYNQGMSFIKYDQVGTFKDPRVPGILRDNISGILNDGLTEFFGNLIVTTYDSELETGAYGKLGQMNESGRDIGHATMALGLAVDIAQQGWNQGDDLFSYMNHRLAAGIEYVAAQTQSVQGLPWVNYGYINNGYYISDGRAWIMEEPALGEQIRPYWGTVIGHYEGIKGVKMPFAEKSYEMMGIDGGGVGATSGGYDHLGYSVLMNTRDGIAPQDKVPTELSPKMAYDGKTVDHNELGGLTNTYQTTAYKNRGLAKGTVVTLSPQLPEGEEDTGKWIWESGETTREITVTANASKMYRVKYTNKNGIDSELCFTIAVLGDCTDSGVTATIKCAGETVTGTSMEVLYGSSVTLTIEDWVGWGNYQWDNGQTTKSITIPKITTDRDIQCYFANQGGRKTLVTFHLTVKNIRPDIIVNDKVMEGNQAVVATEGDKVVLSPYVPASIAYGTWLWDDGSKESTLTVEKVETSSHHTAKYTLDGNITKIAYDIYVKENEDRLVETGDYLILHKASGLYLTNRGDSTVLSEVIVEDGKVNSNQVWSIEHLFSDARYDFVSLADSQYMTEKGVMSIITARPHRISFAKGTNSCAIYNASSQYWVVSNDNTIKYGTTKTLSDFPFEIIPAENGPNGIGNITTADTSTDDDAIYDLLGRRLSGIPAKGFYIKGGKKYYR